MGVLELLQFLGGLPSTRRRFVLFVLAVLDLNSEFVSSIFHVTVKDVNFIPGFPLRVNLDCLVQLSLKVMKVDEFAFDGASYLVIKMRWSIGGLLIHDEIVFKQVGGPTGKFHERIVLLLVRDHEVSLFEL